MSKVVVVTSGKGGVGKTTTSANIATGIALLGHKTATIDFDVGSAEPGPRARGRAPRGLRLRQRHPRRGQAAPGAHPRQAGRHPARAGRLADPRQGGADPRGRRPGHQRPARDGLRIHHLRLARRHREGRPDGHVLRRRGHRGRQPRGLLGARRRPGDRPAVVEDQPGRDAAAARSRPTCCSPATRPTR